MGSIESVPAAFELTVVAGHELLRLKAPPPRPLKAAASTGPFGLAWAAIEALALEVALPRAGTPQPADGHDQSGSLSRFQNRRLALREATLVTDLSLLEEALLGCSLGAAGVKQARLWMGPDGPRLGGRFAVGDVEAPFTIRIGLDPRANGERRLRITFADVRLFAFLPLPAPLIGAAIARAIGTAAAANSAAVRADGAAIEVDPLELALVSALVAEGWRMPDIRHGWLESVERNGDRLRLRFDSEAAAPDQPTNDAGRATATTPSTSRFTSGLAPAGIEGEPLPESLAAAERMFFAGELPAAEAIYRQALATNPDDRAALARVLALAVASAAQDVEELAAAMILRWPNFVHGLLLAAIAALETGDATRAAALFGRAAELADEHGDDEDARLARGAADDARARARDAEQVRRRGDGVTFPTGDDPPAAGPEAQTEDGDGFAPLPAAADPDVPGSLSVGSAGAFPGDARREVSNDVPLSAHAPGAERPGWEGAPERATGSRPGAAPDAVPGSSSSRQPAAAEGGYTPKSPGALALLAEQAFQARDWDRARRFYTLLDRAPEAGKLIARETLVYRRALLARGAGDVAEAETLYGELVTLDPQHLEARQALAQIAFDRRDLETAAFHLEHLLQLLPLDALDALLEVRERLAETYFDLSQWDAARRHGESVLVQEPGRISMLERLAEIYQRLDLDDAAVDAFERLARLYVQPRRRAEALFQQGEIVRYRLGDEARAFDAYLKSSDLDPTFGPTAARLIVGYWSQGKFQDAADVGDELRQGGALELEAPVRLRLALAATLEGGDAGRGATVAELHGMPFDAETAGMGLAEAAGHLSSRPPRDLEPAVTLIETWARQSRVVDRVSLAQLLEPALTARIVADPAEKGAARALGWLADRAGNGIAARGFFSVVAFLDEEDGCVTRLDELGPAPAPSTTAYALAGLSSPTQGGEPTSKSSAEPTSSSSDSSDSSDSSAEPDGASSRITADQVADRFAVFACRSPLAALRALYRAESVSTPGAAAGATERERRIEFLRTTRVRALLRFVVSAGYVAALTDSGDA